MLTSENARPHPAATVLQLLPSPALPVLCAQFLPFKQWFLCSVPRAFLSKDNPCDTDCLILPEPNCGRDKERVKDVPAHCSCHPSSGEQETPLQHPALLRRGKARLRIHSLEVRPGHVFHSPRASLIPGTQKAVKPPSQVFPTLDCCLSCPPVVEM